MLFRCLSEEFRGVRFTLKGNNENNLNTCIAFIHKYMASEQEIKDVEEQIKNQTSEIKALERSLTRLLGRKPTREMLIWGTLAKNGKIPRLDRHDFTASGYTTDAKHNVLRYEHIRSWCECSGELSEHELNAMETSRLKFLIWYDKKLRDNGMEYPLVFMPPMGVPSRYYRSNALPIAGCTGLEIPPYSSPHVAITWLPIAHYLLGFIP